MNSTVAKHRLSTRRRREGNSSALANCDCHGKAHPSSLVTFAHALKAGCDGVRSRFRPHEELVKKGRQVDVRICDRLGGTPLTMTHAMVMLARELRSAGARVVVDHGPPQIEVSCGIVAAEAAWTNHTVGFPDLMCTRGDQCTDLQWICRCNDVVGREPREQVHW